MNPERCNNSEAPPSSSASSTTRSQKSHATEKSKSSAGGVGASFNKKLDSRSKRMSAFEDMERRLEKELEESQIKSKKERLEEMQSGYNVMKEKKQRKWLIKHGKAHVL